MKISIIGGGITGLSSALALHKMGIHAKVYEQAETLNEIGAGVWLQPNAVQILNWLDIKKETAQNGCVLNKMEITKANLAPIKKIEAAVVSDQYGNQTIAIHRGKLQRLLYEKCAKLGLVELGMPYSHHEIDGEKIAVHFTNKTIATDLLLGADGVNSKVRNSMGLPSELRKTGQICSRGIVHFRLPKNLQCEGKEMWGPKRRFGFSQISENEVYFFTVLNREICPEKIDKASLMAQFTDFHPIVNEMIQAAGKMHTTELYDLKRLDTWHSGNACLLGDAAHATTPNMGQGACQGIEDAYYISQYLSTSKTPQTAFAAFEKQRRKKVDYVVNNSWQFGRLAHHQAGQMLLKGIMKITPEKVMSKQMNTLYAVDGL